MTNRERINKCSDRALVRFLLKQRGCIGCVLSKSCDGSPYSPNYTNTSQIGKCEDRLLAWLREESDA